MNPYAILKAALVRARPGETWTVDDDAQQVDGQLALVEVPA